MAKRALIASAILLALLAGAGLRCFSIRDQVPVADEYHAPLVALHGSYATIASHFQRAHSSIPLTLIYKLLLDTVGLTELGMRLLPLALGFLLVIVVPLAARPVLRPGENRLLLVLLAISPQLVFYSRNARPYMISTFLSTLAVVGLLAWVRAPSKRWAMLYTLTGALAVWFHLFALPFVLAPAAWTLITGGPRSSTPRRPVRRPAFLLGAALLAGVVALHVAPWINSSDALTGKLAPARFSWTTFSMSAWLFAGVTSGWVTVGFVGVAVLGAVVLFRRERWMTGCLLGTIVAQAAAVVVVAPNQSEGALVFTRYALWTLPVVLLFFAAGAVSLGRGPWKLVTGGTAVALLIAFSPLWEIYRMPNNFTNHWYYQEGYARGAGWLALFRKLEIQAPPAYRLLADEPEPCLILETPLQLGPATAFIASAQRLHRKSVAIGVKDPGSAFAGHGPFHPRTILPAYDGDRLRERGVKYVFLHRRPQGSPVDPGLEAQEARVQQALGDPVWEDRWVRVFLVSATTGWLGPLRGPVDRAGTGKK
jgi:hypothetical protein